MTRRRRRLVSLFAVAAGMLLAAAASFAAPPKEQKDSRPAGEPGVVSPYIDPRQQTDLQFLQRSHYLQPWRGYEDTFPAERLRDAIGINLNVEPPLADAVCAHLERMGFRHVRIEVGWGSLTEDDPPQLANPGAFAQLMAACRRHHLRPLILLNAHHGAPCPRHGVIVHLLRPAPKGSRVVILDPRDAVQLVPGRSGFDNLSDYRAAEVLFTAIDPDGTAHLSRPLPKDLPEGNPGGVTVLKYAPFYPNPPKVDKPSPEFERTLNGWLAYVRCVGAAAKAQLGTENKPDAGFDFEIWNELTFGSAFLSVNNYYDPPLIPDAGTPIDPIRAATAAFISDPANGLPGVGVSDGFNNEWPWGAGSNEPPGITALGKHPYHGPIRFSASQAGQLTQNEPVDALGHPYGKKIGPGPWIDGWVPDYTAFFPEYYLTGIQTEHVVRDISPITTNIAMTPHGRATHPTPLPGRPAPPPPVLWVTEVNLAPRDLDDRDRATLRAAAGGIDITPAWSARFRAKVILRYLSAWVGKGTDRIYFFAAREGDPNGLGLLSPAFFDAVAAHRSAALAPSDDEAFASPVEWAIRRLVDALTPPPGERLTTARALSLLSVGDRHGHYQFAGNPATAAQKPNPFPPLYDRDCVAFFPFQVSDHRFVAPVYVMTRDMGTLYKPHAPASDPTRTDLPEERFQIRLRGLKPGAHFTLSDPIDAVTLPQSAVRILATDPDGTVTLDLSLTDYPRLLTMTDGPATAAAAPSRQR